MRLRTHLLLLATLIAGALSAPAIGASSQQDDTTGIAIRLLEAPEARRDDPRARAYIVDHVAPGTSFTREIEVINDTDEVVSLQLYDAAAEIRDGSFHVLEGRAENQLTPWVNVAPSQVRLDPRESARARVSVDVPRGAPDGEFYGAALAERPPRNDGGVAVATRVGIRIYLSVGSGAEPISDFRVESVLAERLADGQPVVRATVVNTGGRALDLSGDLRLNEGPGGVSAGPFRAELGTTLQPGGRAPVATVLDPDLPAGPWRAVVTVRSGALERAGEARITFPTAGQAAQPVPAQPVAVPDPQSPGSGPGGGGDAQGTGGGAERGGPGEHGADSRGWLFWLALLLLLILLVFLFLVWFRRRRREDEEEQTAAA